MSTIFSCNTLKGINSMTLQKENKLMLEDQRFDCWHAWNLARKRLCLFKILRQCTNMWHRTDVLQLYWEVNLEPLILLICLQRDTKKRIGSFIWTLVVLVFRHSISLITHIRILSSVGFPAPSHTHTYREIRFFLC